MRRGDPRERRRTRFRRSVPAPTRSCENHGTHGISEDHPMDKKAKTPKKPKQTKTKDGAAKGK
jgi:hypothetical protein